VRREAAQEEGNVLGELLPPRFKQWHALAQAQFLEIKILLSQYLLSTQGDRMGMAHSIEGRFPFLDCRLVEFCNQLPPRLKLRVLKEKYILKQLGRRWLPPEIWQRPKRPYRAPIHRCFFNQATPDYVLELLSKEKVGATGLFKASAVEQLVQKIRQGRPVSETDDMAVAGILSSQLVHAQFVAGFRRAAPLSSADDVRVCRAVNTPSS
jgi:asparagine synthase (glutamine-hydrolysing)